jgi:uncharacterized protein involved in response to NO
VNKTAIDFVVLVGHWLAALIAQYIPPQWQAVEVEDVQVRYIPALLDLAARANENSRPAQADSQSQNAARVNRSEENKRE